MNEHWIREMKRIKFKSLFLVITVIATMGSGHLLGQTSVMTFNIRYDNPQDGQNRWEHRKQDLVSMLESYAPDILGVQEALKTQLDFLDDQLLTYNYLGVGRDDGLEKGEFTAIFYDTTKLTLIETQTYWLSDTPETVSIGWDASMERIVTYGAFKLITTNDTLHIFNAHYDHIGKSARKNSSLVILKLITQKKLDSKKLVVMGDFNCESPDEPILALRTKLQDSFQSTLTSPVGPQGTWQSFDPQAVPQRRIDYIFTSNLVVEHYRNIDERRKNKLCLSDHLPVYIEVN